MSHRRGKRGMHGRKDQHRMHVMMKRQHEADTYGNTATTSSREPIECQRGRETTAVKIIP
ncbi:uncharacterized protein FOMMEDRAFT_153573 [Fomitiporia mediterranea MF3/22]|uniref:uncharacterized protein n=1 Tax=Fomitiporia mediterranea (strain MF3/22) TaxID=694068 RepID=UPI0004408D1C|nr:uncharacterized protein FOMMEDRAFT_153573 [Fomitiporia mediterranea MF3/22]EJD06175.1 hypothetical protein FOMMEDRAFT_153573 [Fomitiporia mediterranea MF3/22]